MDEVLKQLLNQLEVVGATNEEIYDSECRDRMSDAILDGFVRHRSDYLLPGDFGLYTLDANATVREALAKFIDVANRRTASDGLTSCHRRLNAFQNDTIRSDVHGKYYDDFFGYASPEAFDDCGSMSDEGG
jgi:hypothetical protein